MAKPIKITILGDASQFRREMGNVGSRLGSFGGAAVKTAGIATAALGGLAVVGGKHLFDVGEDLVGLDTKINTVFTGQSLEDVSDWADEVAGRMGLTSTQAQGLAANAGDLLKPMGFTADRAAEMSTEIVGLSGALSEWSGGNRSVDETAQILQKALLGERESLKELGISINQAEVDSRALQVAQADGRDEITQMDKAVATQQLIMEKSTDAQAAFAEGGNELTAAQNKLKAEFGELQEVAARKLLPMFADIAGFVTDDLIPVIQKHAPRAFAFFQTEVMPTVRRVADFITEVFGRVVSWVRENWPQIQATISAVVERIQEIVTVVLDALVIAWETWGDNIVTFVQEAIGPIIQIVEGLVVFFEGVIDFLVGTFTGDWERAWDGIKAIFTGAWDVIVGAVELAWAALKLAVTAILDGVKLLWDWSFLSDWVGTAVDSVVGFFVGLPQRIIDLYVDIYTAAFDLGLEILGGIWDGLGDLGQALVDFFKAAWDKVVEWFEGIVSLDFASKIPVIGGLFGGSTQLPGGKNVTGGVGFDFGAGSSFGVDRATGGPIRGLSLVGERGPELVAGVGTVLSHAETRARGASTGPLVGTLIVNNGTPGEVLQMLRMARRTSAL